MKKVPFILSLLLVAVLSGWSQNPRNVVLYDLTSTDCGHCTCLDSMMRLFMLPAYPQTIALALHSPFNSSFGHFQGNTLEFFFNAHFAPAVNLDGTGPCMQWMGAQDSLTARYAASPDAPVAIAVTAKSWDPASRKVTLSVSMTNLTEAIDGVVRCNLFVAESNLIALHRVETGCATPNEPSGLPFKTDYCNDHVVRKVEFIPDSTVTNPHWGEDLKPTGWPSGETITRTWTVSLDTGWVESNCSLNLIVYKDNQDSLYKSIHLQGIRESVTGGVSVPPQQTTPAGSGISLVYPNPASGWTTIHLVVTEPGACTLELLNLRGEVVETLLQQSLQPGTFNAGYNTSELPAGTYLLRFQTGTRESVERLVVR